MKALKLKALELGAREILSREQMKAVSGGAGCQSDMECPPGLVCSDGICADGSGGGRCRDQRSCTIAVPGDPNAAGICETNSVNRCICKALDYSASAASAECLA
ncbi:hypothetical protein HF324_04455 [Chitinophaga oryzae]|uniref:Uncharacterized protein n=1 Tax=Chitinophaga oryzae TaxID=2725414 RepID=A0AAE7D741_9BACT|nr:hypothetical protein [Chitinophaga oryzae]QJB30646.1 hypothetical protein HF329_04750 [Chitinophaga oryzae]QJB37146.1 hypothetical protein HF324_04455 [Chitinophaga oryzae]